MRASHASALWTALVIVSCGRPSTWSPSSQCSPQHPDGEQCTHRMAVTVAADATKGYTNTNLKDGTLLPSDRGGRQLLRGTYSLAAADLKCAVLCNADRRVEIRPWSGFTDNELSVMLVHSGWSALANAVEGELRRVIGTKQATLEIKPGTSVLPSRAA